MNTRICRMCRESVTTRKETPFCEACYKIYHATLGPKPPKHHSNTPIELYRHFDANNTLLYVGISLTTTARLAQHRHCSKWFDRITKITIERFPTREEAAAAERKAIRLERPLFNVDYGTHPRQSRAIVTMNEMARLLGISTSHLAEMMDSGTCPVKPMTKTNGWLRIHVDAYLAMQESRV